MAKSAIGSNWLYFWLSILCIGVGVICYFTTVGFVDNELVGACPDIEDLTSVPFPCYNVTVSNGHRRGVCRFNLNVKAM